MSNQPFESGLPNELNRGEFSPKYRERLMKELGEHRKDLIDEEVKKGTDPSRAKKIASNKLGDPENIIQSVIHRLRSVHLPGRYPFFFFFFLPLISFFGVSYFSTSLVHYGLQWTGCLVENCKSVLTASSFKSLFWLSYSMVKYVVPLFVGLGFYRLVRRCYWGWKGVSLLLTSFALFTLISQVEVSPPAIHMAETMVQSIETGSLGFQLQTEFDQIMNSVISVCTSTRFGLLLIVLGFFHLRERMNRLPDRKVFEKL